MSANYDLTHIKVPQPSTVSPQALQSGDCVVMCECGRHLCVYDAPNHVGGCLDLATVTWTLITPISGEGFAALLKEKGFKFRRDLRALFAKHADGSTARLQ